MSFSFKYKVVVEDAAVEQNVFSSDTDLATDDNKTDTNVNNVETAKKTITKDDVEKLSDGDVMNYVYFNPPKELDDDTRQTLYSKADEIRKKRMTNGMSPNEQEEFAKKVILGISKSNNNSSF